MWPNARIAIENPNRLSDAIDAEALKQTSSALFSTSRCWDDGIILPQQTRKVYEKFARDSPLTFRAFQTLSKCLSIIEQSKGVHRQDMKHAVHRL